MLNSSEIIAAMKTVSSAFDSPRSADFPRKTESTQTQQSSRGGMPNSGYSRHICYHQLICCSTGSISPCLSECWAACFVFCSLHCLHRKIANIKNVMSTVQAIWYFTACDIIKHQMYRITEKCIAKYRNHLNCVTVHTYFQWWECQNFNDLCNCRTIKFFRVLCQVPPLLIWMILFLKSVQHICL